MSQPTGLPINQVLIGDVRTKLAELPDAAVDCIITSPPYFAMRDYGHEAQIGTEATVEDWAANIAAICSELWRVLTPIGALFLNLGDGYARHHKEGTHKKSLLLGPQRVALRLTRSGWLLRNQVIWAKKNPMPSSVTDRLSNTHEFLYFFTKQQHYYFDLDAIREPKAGKLRRPGRVGATYPPIEAVPTIGKVPRIDLNQGLTSMKAEGRDTHPLGKNPGDVWLLATASYRGSHFATFPVELVRRPLLATCPEMVCTACGQPWQRATQVIDGRQLATGPLRASCGCRAPSRRGIVLDPFMGAGTVALAAGRARPRLDRHRAESCIRQAHGTAVARQAKPAEPSPVKTSAIRPPPRTAFLDDLWPLPSSRLRDGRSHHAEEGVRNMSEPKNAGVKTLGIRLPDELHAQFALVASLDGLSLTDAIRRAVELYVESKQSEGDFAARAQQALEEIEREAAARREAITALFGQNTPADGADAKSAPRTRRS